MASFVSELSLSVPSLYAAAALSLDLFSLFLSLSLSGEETYDRHGGAHCVEERERRERETERDEGDSPRRKFFFLKSEPVRIRSLFSRKKKKKARLLLLLSFSFFLFSPSRSSSRSLARTAVRLFVEQIARERKKRKRHSNSSKKLSVSPPSPSQLFFSRQEPVSFFSSSSFRALLSLSEPLSTKMQHAMMVSFTPRFSFQKMNRRRANKRHSEDGGIRNRLSRSIAVSERAPSSSFLSLNLDLDPSSLVRFFPLPLPALSTNSPKSKQQ